MRRSLHAGVSGDRHPRTTPILLTLGHVYSRSARVTFAEGLFRECAKIFGVQDPTQAQVARSGGGRAARQFNAHASLLGVLAWRFHQLLSVLPNRGAVGWG
jgi:hypothetical protein